jgi:hypothetical protein
VRSALFEGHGLQCLALCHTPPLVSNDMKSFDDDTISAYFTKLLKIGGHFSVFSSLYSNGALSSLYCVDRPQLKRKFNNFPDTYYRAFPFCQSIFLSGKVASFDFLLSSAICHLLHSVSLNSGRRAALSGCEGIKCWESDNRYDYL